MFINGIGTAVPPRRYLKSECWPAFAASEWFDRFGPRTHALIRAVLENENGIEARHLAVERLEEAFLIDPDTLHKRFRTHAPALAHKAAAEAMERAGITAREVDAVVVSTCTGYLCPGLSSYAVEHLGLRADVQAFDLVGQGCGAALPNMRLARSLIAAGAGHVLSVCVEVCSAAMYMEEDAGVLISACLFGDGAGAAVLSRRPAARVRRVEWKDAESLTNPEERETLMFEQRGGMLRNVLTREVPAAAARHAQAVLRTVLDRNALPMHEIRAWIMHAGGREVLAAVARAMGVDDGDFHRSEAALRRYGNLSSAFVYFVLGAALAEEAPGGPWWMSSFGAGFSCHGALLEVA